MSVDTNNRVVFTGADWYSLATQTFGTMIGAGGIGSWTYFFLNKLGLNLALFDDDFFEERNLGGQLVSKNMINVNKAVAASLLAIQTSKSRNEVQNIGDKAIFSKNLVIAEKWLLEAGTNYPPSDSGHTFLNYDPSLNFPEESAFDTGLPVSLDLLMYKIFRCPDPYKHYTDTGTLEAQLSARINYVEDVLNVPRLRTVINTLPYFIILGPDSMIPRKDVFKLIKSYYNYNVAEAREDSPAPFVVIDGRLTAEQYQIYTYNSFDKTSLDYYENTLFNDSDIPPLPCNFKQTSHVAASIATTITEIITNILANIQMYLCEETVLTAEELVKNCYYEGPRIVPIQVIGESSIMLKKYKLITDVS